MPFYKTKILNREISLEYEKKDEMKIIDSINLNIQKSSEVNEANNEEYLKYNLELKDKLLKLQNEKKNLEDEKLKLDKEFDEIIKKVEELINIIKNSYYE